MEEVIQYVPNLYATFWALIPPLVAIILALITKEVYSSLFVGIVIGGLFYGNIFQSGFSFEKSVLHIFEDGLESRDFINVVDIAKGVIAAIDNAKSNSEIINLGSGVGTSVIDIANMLKEIYDSDSDINITGDFRIGDIAHNIADIQKAEDILGFKQTISLREGLTQFCQWVLGEDKDNSGYENSLIEMEKAGMFIRG